jgi:hypothetical protein
MGDIADKASAASVEDCRGDLTLRLIISFGDDLKVFEIRLPNVSAVHYRRAVMHGSECIARVLRALASLVGRCSL